MNNSTGKPFTDSSEIKLRSPETVLDWGKTLVVAPHPDDESLGGGGAIALLREYEREVRVLTMSDGTLSHPNSKIFPPEKLRDLRESEMRDALEILDVAENKIKFLRFRDRRVPNEDAADFAAAVTTVREYLNEIAPETIIVPWRRDPHPDHRATWQIFNAARKFFDGQFRFLEYPIWLWEMAEKTDLPQDNEVTIWRLDISQVVERKQRAIFAHRSQTTDLIDDDPKGFRLSTEVLAHFAAPFETYLEELK